jgi:ubiquinone/menaquinone biosynthesis C-methylase UbiE
MFQMAANQTPSPEAYMQRGSVIMDRIRTALIGGAIRSKLPPKRPMKLLDIGCGYLATNLIQNLDLLSEGWGIDLAVAPEVRRPNLNFIEQPVQEALNTLPSNYFDAILFISVLEHLWHPVDALSECFRVLAPGGRVIINVPTWNAKPVLEASAFRFGTSTASSIEDHKMYYSKRELWPMVIKAGFAPSKVRMSYRFLGMVLITTATK